MRPVARSEIRLTIRAIQLVNETDAALLALLVRGCGSDAVTKKAARNVLKTRGYMFDKKTRVLLAVPERPKVTAAVVGTLGAEDATITWPTL